MRCAALVLAVVLPGIAGSAPPQSMGTLKEGDPDFKASLDVKDAVAVFDADEAELMVHLLSQHPNAQQLAELKATTDRQTHACLKLSWQFENKRFVGDVKKAHIWLYYWANNANWNINCNGDEYETSLSGPLKEGQEITLKFKGTQRTKTWDLNIKTKVYKLKKD